MHVAVHFDRRMRSWRRLVNREHGAKCVVVRGLRGARVSTSEADRVRDVAGAGNGQSVSLPGWKGESAADWLPAHRLIELKLRRGFARFRLIGYRR